MHRIIFIFFFFSGFSSLVFEVIWARMLQQVFGSTSFAISTLLTAFMAGLALGSYLGGKLASHLKVDQLRVYAFLEAGIGAYALIVPLLLAAMPGLYGFLFEHFLEDFYLFSLLRFLAVFLILLIPTTLMGATLPLVSQWIAERRSSFQEDLGYLYGANTFGACTGTFLAGFFLLPTLGLSTTNVIFASINFCLALVVLLLAPQLQGRIPDETKGAASLKREEELDEELLRIIALPRDRADAHGDFTLRVALVLFAVSGLVSMAYQVLWTRAYVITLGSSTYSFTLVLTAVLVGIALGSAVLSAVVRRIQRPLFFLSLTQFGVALAALGSFLVLDRVPLWLFNHMRGDLGSLFEVYAFQFGLVALAVFLPSFLQGMSFPLMMRAVTTRMDKAGEEVGRAYAYNTAGAILGSFLSGFLLLPFLGLTKAIFTLIVVNLVVAICFSALEWQETKNHWRGVVLLAIALVGVVSFWATPPLDQARLTAGVFRAHMVRDMMSSRSMESRNAELLFFRDGLTATTSVERVGDTLVLKANGKPEASDGADMATQVMVGLLPFILRGAWEEVEIGAEEVAMIGFGSGVTAGASLQWPLKSLEVVEIEATMIAASRFFEHVNNRPLSDPRHRVIESDGRNYLEYTGGRYDVIISEPSNPWIAGVSALFTKEFFTKVREKLKPNGVYAQWVQLYELRPENVRRVMRTFTAVFPYVHAFSSKPKSTDLILIGSNEPLNFSLEGLDRAWAIPKVRQELERIGMSSVDEILGLLFMTHQELLEFSAEAKINTDDNGLLEYSAPQDLIFYEEGQQFFARFYYQTPYHGDPRPYLENWPQGFDAVHQARLIRSVWVAGKPELAAALYQEAKAAGEPEEELSREWIEVRAVLEASQWSFQEIFSYEESDTLKEIGRLARRNQWRLAESLIENLSEEERHLEGAFLLLATIKERRRSYADAFKLYWLAYEQKKEKIVYPEK